MNARVHVPADLRHALALEPVHACPGLYRGELDRSWSFILPSGGVLASVALAAMRAEIGRLGLAADGITFVPAAATATFCSAIAEGPIDVEVVVLRAGRTACQLRAHLRPRGQAAAPGDVGLEVAATFVQAANPLGLEAASFVPHPEVPPAEACELYDPDSNPTTPNFYRNLEVRRVRGDVWWRKTWDPGPPHVSRYYRYLVPPALPDGRLDPLALPPIADTMAAAVHQAVGSRNPPLLFPSLDLTLHFIAPGVGDPHLPVLVDTRATAVFASAASGTATVWQGGRLLLTATQTMTLRTLKGR